MKFAQELGEELVPEWKAQYLDYKKGKKKLKKITNSFGKDSPALDSLRGNLGVNSGPRNVIQDDDELSPTTSRDERQARVDDATTSFDSAFQLPPPAIEDEGESMDPVSRPERRDMGDTTPLLYTASMQQRRRNEPSPHTASHPKTPADSPEINPHPSLLRRQSLLSNITEGSPLKRVMSLKSLIRRASIVATPVSFMRGRGGPSNTPDVPLESSFETGKKEFIVWLDSEFDKIDGFYKEKENDCYNRFLILQDQLYQLREARLRIKQEEAVHAEHHGVVNINDLAQHTKQTLGEFNKLELPSFPTFKFLRSTSKESHEHDKEDENFENQIRNGKFKASDITPDILQPAPSVASNRTETTTATNGAGNRNNPMLNIDRTAYNKRDYSKPSHVPYFTAKRQIKAAVQEYYRSLELLKSYRMLNRTAFRKMIKKYDKTTKSKRLPEYMEKINNAYFSTSDVLDNLFLKVEELYALYFENGNKKIATEKLRSKEKADSFYASFFGSGFFLGFALPLLVLAIYSGVSSTLRGDLVEGRYMLQIWGGFLLITIMALLFGVNCYIWDSYKINYKFIFEFNVKTALNFKQFLLTPSFSFFLMALVGWFSLNNFWPQDFPGRDWPWLYVGVMLIIFLWPGDFFYLESRRWLQVALWRILFSGFYPVEFRDFFIGDILCSLTYSMGNISFFVCLYASHWHGVSTGTDKCGSSHSRLMGFFSTLPSIWRFLQCFRRYADTGDWFPHLANMLKYSVSAVYYIMLSIYRIDRTLTNRAVFILFATINSLFSSAWDILMDWSLLQSNSKVPLLRNDLVFKRPWFYYTAMVVDVILRFQWIFYGLFSDQIQQSAVTSFCIGVAEILRRFMWMIFRMENEHTTNVLLFRASRETALPYPVGVSSKQLRPKKPLPLESVHDHEPRDEESAIGLSKAKLNRYGSINTGSTSSPTTPTLTRRKSMFVPSSQVLDQVSRALTNAHIKDFQRRKVNPSDIHEDGDSTDDDDDEMGSHHGSSASSIRAHHD